jgi:PEP-CTERM motif
VRHGYLNGTINEKGEIMNKLLIGLGVVVLLFTGGTNTNASLITYSDDVVYDNVANKYWFRDLSLFPDKTYDEQITLIDSHSFTHEYRDGWRMANSSEYNRLLSNGVPSIMAFFAPTTIQINQNNTAQNIKYYRGRLHDDVSDEMNTVVGFFYKNYWPGTGINYYSPVVTSESTANIYYGAWVVADALHDTLEPKWIAAQANPTPTPEPATILLLGTGVIGLVGIRNRKKRRKII